MTNYTFSLPQEYWQNFSITPKDVDAIQNYLFETEKPLGSKEIARVLINERIKTENDLFIKEQRSAGEIYTPGHIYSVGQSIVFPALNFAKGKVQSVRQGNNPDHGVFEVMQIDLADGSTRSFAFNLLDHKLNKPAEEENDPSTNVEAVITRYGLSIEKKISQALAKDGNLVQIAYMWFPEALLVTINKGNLNLAEAILEMNDGQPMTTQELMSQIDLSDNSNNVLTEFSVNYALQEDGRFDEVGPVGLVQWFLKRLEPEGVQNVPALLQYNPIEYDNASLPAEVIQFEEQIDDELSELERSNGNPNEVSITLSFPHWRSGTLPISGRTINFFPTSLEAPRVLFSFVDERSGERFPAWVVRDRGYVFGLQKLFDKYKLIPGSILQLRKGHDNSEIIVDVKSRKASKEWVRTVLAGSDGGLVFAILKQEVSGEYNERLAIVVPDIASIDSAIDHIKRSTRGPERIIRDVMIELTKLNPQGNVHAEEIYSAVNILLRIPPAPLLAILNSSEKFTHVGDLHYRIVDTPVEGK